MRKLLLALTAMSSVAFASSLDMNNLSCKTMKITASTTLAQVQSNCTIAKQKTSGGLYEVEFTNNATNKSVTCKFAANTPAATVNSCK